MEYENYLAQRLSIFSSYNCWSNENIVSIYNPFFALLFIIWKFQYFSVSLAHCVKRNGVEINLSSTSFTIKNTNKPDFFIWEYFNVDY